MASADAMPADIFDREQYLTTGQVRLALRLSRQQLKRLVDEGYLNSRPGHTSIDQYFLSTRVEEVKRMIQTGELFIKVNTLNRHLYYSGRETSLALGCWENAVLGMYEQGLITGHITEHRHYFHKSSVQELKRRLNEGELMTAIEAQIQWGVESSTLWHWRKRGRIRWIQVAPELWLITRQEVERVKRLLSKEYIGLAEAARLLRVNKTTLWRWAKQGRIKTVRLTPKWQRYPRSEILRLKRIRGKPYLTLKEAGELLGTTVKDLLWLIQQGIVDPPRLIDGRVLMECEKIENTVGRAYEALSRYSPFEASD